MGISDSPTTRTIDAEPTASTHLRLTVPSRFLTRASPSSPALPRARLVSSRLAMWSSSAAAEADPPAPADGAPQPPELSEAGYLREVLHLTARQTEADVVDELIAKASALGIATASRPSTPGKADISSADSATTSHARNSSTDSDASASTALTSPSIHGAPALEPPSPALRRRRSKSLSFSQYDKYLAQVDPNLEQPKFRLEAPPEPAPSLFSVSTRKSYQSIKRVLKNRVTRKKRSTPAFGALKSVTSAGPTPRPLFFFDLGNICSRRLANMWLFSTLPRSLALAYVAAKTSREHRRCRCCRAGIRTAATACAS